MEEELSEVYLDMLASDEIIIENFKQQLYSVNEAIDNVYTNWSSFPSNPGKEKCSKYIKTGLCSLGAKCKYDHPFREVINNEVEKDMLLLLTYITERLMKILKTFSYEAAVDVLSSLCKIIKLLEFYYDIALTHPSYGQICYLYGDVIIRLSLDIDHFCSNKLSQRRVTPRFKRKDPQIVDSNFYIFENCSERLEIINKKWLDWEEEIRKETISQLYKDNYNDIATNKIISKLSNWIFQYSYDCFIEQEKMKITREEIRIKLLTSIKNITIWSEIIDKIDLISFGSNANLLGNSNSDMDLTLQLPETFDHIQSLELVGQVSQNIGFTINEIVKETRVPVLKLYDEINHIEIDIVVNNHLATYNTTLLRNYALVDPRVRPLVLAIKYWAKCRGCNNPKNATLTSYAWTLMLLYFLRTHTHEPQIPSIEEVSKIVEEMQLNENTMLESFKEYYHNSQTQFGKLFIEFFAFYGTCSPNGFQPFHSIVSLRNSFRVYKKSSHLHTGEKLKSVNEVLNNQHSFLKIIKTVSNELLLDEVADTARTEAEEISNMVVYSLSPSWRFCIEDPYEEHDLGRVIYCLSGQIHMMNEMKRCLTIFNDLVVQYRLHIQDREQYLQRTGNNENHHHHHHHHHHHENSENNNNNNNNNNEIDDQFDFWKILSTINLSIPVAIKTCNICGQQGHFTKECNLMKCHLCNEKGHFMKDCIRLFCSNCRQQGHFAKDCPKERLCRYCKQSGHDVKDCPHKLCQKCGSKNHTTFRCKNKSIHQNNNAANNNNNSNNDNNNNNNNNNNNLQSNSSILNSSQSQLQSTTTTTTTILSQKEYKEVNGNITHIEEKLSETNNRVSNNESTIELKNRSRKGRVPPLPLEAKLNSLAKLSDIRPLGMSIKIIQPTSPNLDSPNDSTVNSPILYPSDAKLSSYHSMIASPTPSETQEELYKQEIKLEVKENTKKKKKRKEKMRENIEEDRDRSYSIDVNESTSPIQIDHHQQLNHHQQRLQIQQQQQQQQQRRRNPSIDLSSANSSPRETYVSKPKKRYPNMSNISSGHGATTSERFAQAIRTPIIGSTSIEDKKEIKSSVHFENGYYHNNHISTTTFSSSSSILATTTSSGLSGLNNERNNYNDNNNNNDNDNMMNSDIKLDSHHHHHYNYYSNHKNRLINTDIIELDQKIASPKHDAAILERKESFQNKMNSDFSNGAKSNTIIRPNRINLDPPTPIDLLNSELSDLSIGSPLPNSPFDIIESKIVVNEVKKETKVSKRNRKKNKNQLQRQQQNQQHHHQHQQNEDDYYNDYNGNGNGNGNDDDDDSNNNNSNNNSPSINYNNELMNRSRHQLLDDGTAIESPAPQVYRKRIDKLNSRESKRIERKESHES